MASSPKISICIPMYNAARFIKDCIDSVLSQSFKDFELLVVDDGSNDDSCDIVNSIKDNRIRLIQNKHDYVGSLNMLLDEAKGKYIARMDADDVMYPNRLAIQYEYMESHPNVDVVGGRMVAFKRFIKEPLYDLNVKSGSLCISDMLDNCCICHPTVMFRAASINGKEKFRYDKQMAYAEDYDLWMRMLASGKKFFNLEEKLTYYRLHEQQVTTSHHEEQAQKSKVIRTWALRKQIVLENKAFHEPAMIPETTNKLTVVMPFKNEGEEVANTVKSIRDTAGMSVDIIAIDDDCDDGFDYEGSLRGMNVTYVRNSYRLGASLSKERGAQLAKTPYFILLDAHMRFYDSEWATYIVRELDANPQRLLCCKSVCLQKDEKGIVSVHPKSYSPQGAYLSFCSNKYVPAIDWNNYTECLPTCAENQIPCVLGAGYVTSKSYWNKIRGLQGLLHYGCEEAYISIKAWKEGGGCYLLPNLTIGHIYRKKFPYPVYSFQCIYNNLIISELLFPTSERCYAKAVAWNLSKDTYFKAMEYMSLHKNELDKLAKHYKTFQQNDFSYVKRLNDICRKVAQKSIRITEEEDIQVRDYILKEKEKISDAGLFTGLSGVFIAALLYTESGFSEFENLVYEVWERLSKSIKESHDLTFQNGLAGIGWALIYAASHNLIEDSIEEELVTIDKKIICMSVKRNQDLSFLEGVGGIYCYVVARLGFNKRNKESKETFSQEFLQEMDEQVHCILKECKDWRTLNFVSQYTERLSDDWEILAPEFPEIVDLPDYIPNTQKNWDLSLSGVIGSVINKMTNEYNKRNEEKSL